MASAVLDNVALSLPLPAEPFPWINPRISFRYDLADLPPGSATEHRPEPDAAADDFEFLLDNPVAMLPAEELFSGGKLVPLQMAPAKPAADVELEAEADAEEKKPPAAEIGLPEHPESRQKTESAPPDPYAFSPRAPRCTQRWRELLGLRRVRGPKPGVQVNATAGATSAEPAVTSKKASSRSSVKVLLHRNLKPAASLDASQSVPLLQRSDHENTGVATSRLSSSSGPDQEDLARLSIDSDKQTHVAPRGTRTSPGAAAERARTSKSANARAWNKQSTTPPSLHGASVDSPRMSSSGRIVFRGLERSSSSPGGFARPRRPRAVERSYSAHVRVTPVLNVVVPVRSLRGSSKAISVFGFSHLFSPQQRKDGAATVAGRPAVARPVRRQQQRDRDTAPSI